MAANGQRRTLESAVSVSACNPGGSAFTEFKGLWDTGATRSVITQKVVDGGGGGCPVLVFGMKEALYDKNC